MTQGGGNDCDQSDVIHIAQLVKQKTIYPKLPGLALHGSTISTCFTVCFCCIKFVARVLISKENAFYKYYITLKRMVMMIFMTMFSG